MSTIYNPLPGWSPPNSAGGPQNNNVIQYSGALTQALGCDPIKGCAPAATVQEPNTGQSLQGWINTITGQTAAPAPATQGQSAPGAYAAGSCSWWNPFCSSVPGQPGVSNLGGTCSWWNPFCKTTPEAAAGQGGMSVARAVAVVLGLICVAGAIYLFKGVA